MAAMEINYRITDVDKQINEIGCFARDVVADGNCLFRAVSYSFFGHEDSHSSLRSSAAAFLDVHSTPAWDALDTDTRARHLQIVRTLGQAAGEDTIWALANVCQRPIQVFTAYAAPLIYNPVFVRTWSTDDYIRIGFYEPGHYKTVLRTATTPPCSAATTHCSLQAAQHLNA